MYEPAYSETCVERPPVLKDHIFLAGGHRFQCNLLPKPPVLRDHNFMANKAVFQDRFYCTSLTLSNSETKDWEDMYSGRSFLRPSIQPEKCGLKLKVLSKLSNIFGSECKICCNMSCVTDGPSLIMEVTVKSMGLKLQGPMSTGAGHDLVFGLCVYKGYYTYCLCLYPVHLMI